MSNSAAALRLDKVHMRFTQGARDLHVLQGASLEIAAGEVVALVGPSGSGKSTLLHIAGLLEKPQSGAIMVNGEAAAEANDKARTALRLQHIGFVYQFHNLLPEFSAQENVAMPLRLTGQTKGAALSEASALLEKLGLGERLTHMPSQLSGGEQQRVAIARALANHPALILADEPTGSLDGQAGETVAALLLDEARARQTAVLLATHDMELAARTDRIMRLKDGHILSE